MGGRGGGSPGAKSAKSAEMTPAQRLAEGLAPYPNLSPEEQVEKIWQDLAAGQSESNGPAPFVRMSDIQDRLSSMSRERYEEAMKKVGMMKNARVIAVANMVSLSPRDMAAGVRMGGETKNAVSFEYPSDSSFAKRRSREATRSTSLSFNSEDLNRRSRIFGG